jgi:hypothetical protein
MRSAISRYGARVLPDTEQIADACKARGEYIQGPQIAEFERAFERRAGGGTAITAAWAHRLLLHAEGARPATGSKSSFRR